MAAVENAPVNIEITVGEDDEGRYLVVTHGAADTLIIDPTSISMLTGIIHVLVDEQDRRIPDAISAL